MNKRKHPGDSVPENYPILDFKQSNLKLCRDSPTYQHWMRIFLSLLPFPSVLMHLIMEYFLFHLYSRISLTNVVMPEFDRVYISVCKDFLYVVSERRVEKILLPLSSFSKPMLYELSAKLLSGHVTIFDDVIYHFNKYVDSDSKLVCYKNFKTKTIRDMESESFTRTTCFPTHWPSADDIHGFDVDSSYIYILIDLDVEIYSNTFPFGFVKRIENVGKLGFCFVTFSNSYLFISSEDSQNDSNLVHVFNKNTDFSLLGCAFIKEIYPAWSADFLLNMKCNLNNGFLYCVWKKEINVFDFDAEKGKFCLIQNITIEPMTLLVSKNEFFGSIAFGPNGEFYVNSKLHNKLLIIR